MIANGPRSVVLSVPFLVLLALSTPVPAAEPPSAGLQLWLDASDSATLIKYFVDGVIVRRIKNTDWHDPLHMQFDSETMPTWFGMPQDADLPSTYSIEYIRVWRQARE